MELEEDGFAQLFVEVVRVREFGGGPTRREVVQRVVECVAERVGRFNGDKIPSYMQAYMEAGILVSDRDPSDICKGA